MRLWPSPPRIEGRRPYEGTSGLSQEYVRWPERGRARRHYDEGSDDQDLRIAMVLNRSLPCLHHRSPDADFGSWHRERRPDQRWAECGHIASRLEGVIHGVVCPLPLPSREFAIDRGGPERLQPPACTPVAVSYPRLPDPHRRALTRRAPARLARQQVWHRTEGGDACSPLNSAASGSTRSSKCGACRAR